MLGCLVSFQHEGFCLALLYLVLFCLTDAGFFSEEEMECICGKREVGVARRGGERGNWVRMHCRKEEAIFNKNERNKK